MNERGEKHFDILLAKKAYAQGKNITEILRGQKNVDFNTSEIIELAYDLQAGTYIEKYELDPVIDHDYASELAIVLDRYIDKQSTLLDVGTGELTTLSLLSSRIFNKPKKYFAFDISWSRLYKGLAFAKKIMLDDYDRLMPFVADINEIPLPDKSICVTTSSHALEPNGGRLPELMAELFRVTSDVLVLFEPCYEINSAEGKLRMDRLGYIKDIDGVAKKLGGEVIQKIKIANIANPLNPTVCFIIKPPSIGSNTINRYLNIDNIYSVPGTSHHLDRLDDFYFSRETGLCFPILKSIPILRSSAAILATALVQ